MASLCEDRGRPDKRGRRPKLWRIVFKAADGRRKPLRLGAIPERKAQNILGHVAQLEACLMDGSAPPPETSAWVAKCGSTLRDRLVRAGLAAPKAKPLALTLGELVDAYKARPRWKALKPNSIRSQELHLGYLLRHFGANREVLSIAEADGEDYHGKLRLTKGQGGHELSQSSSESSCSMAHRLFRFAIKARLIDRNPFDDTPRGKSQRGNNVHVAAADALKVLAELPGSEWKLLFALSRWGGLRVPSEPAMLRWGDVDWERQRFLVHAPKTERHEAHATRWVPMFPELAKLFDERWDDAERQGDHGELVLPMMAGGSSGKFSSRVAAAAERADVERWPRLWHSMRSTRQTELAAEFPLHVVCAWLGNSEAVAAKHYLQTFEEHFEKAARNAARTVQESSGIEGNNLERSPAIHGGST